MKPWELVPLASARLGSALCQPSKCIDLPCIGGYAYVAHTLDLSGMQTKPTTIATPSLRPRSADLARSLSKAGYPSIKELTTRPSRRETPWRPNSHPMHQMEMEFCATWDVTCSHWHRGAGVLFECNVLHSGLSDRSNGLTDQKCAAISSN